MNITPATPTKTHPEDDVPSAFTHPTYQFSNETGKGYDEKNRMIRVASTNNPAHNSQCVGSAIITNQKTKPKDVQHTIMLDIDLPATLLPSSTPGHHHLYIDYPIPWDKYANLLKALHEAGIIEKGFYDSAIRDKQTYLRMPGITKKTGATTL